MQIILKSNYKDRREINEKNNTRESFNANLFFPRVLYLLEMDRLDFTDLFDSELSSVPTSLFKVTGKPGFDNGSIKQWHGFKREHNLHESFYFQWLQLIDSIPQRWKIIIKENYENAINFIIHDHHLVKDSRVRTVDKLTSTDIYSILISRAQNKPSSNAYFENPYNDYNIDWTSNYTPNY